MFYFLVLFKTPANLALFFGKCKILSPYLKIGDDCQIVSFFGE